MVRHIVLWTFKEGVDKVATFNALKARFATFTGQVPGLLAFNLYAGAQGWDVCLTSDHEDFDALAAYQAFPAHIEMKAVVKETRQDRASCDFEL